MKDENSTTETFYHDDAGIPENPGRSFLKKSALGGIAIGGAFMLSFIEEVIARSMQKTRRYSAPSDLKITDMR